MAEYIERDEIRRAYEKLTRSYVHDDPYIADWRFDEMIENLTASDVAPVRHGRWEDGRCSNCKEEAVSTSWDEPIYDYDWEENLRYSYTETHTEYRLTNYCPNCGAKMDGGAD